MTEELPEMRASDAERERIADVLKEAVAEGRLGVDEFQERLDSAYRARTRGELEPLVRDLPTPGATSLVKGHGYGYGQVAGSRAPAPRRPGAAERIGGRGTSSWGVGILGGFGRKGNWTVPRAFTGVAIMGGGELDLREARFEEREVVIRCFVFMGGIDVVVPSDVEVEVRGIGIMGGFDSSASGEHTGGPDAPRVVVTGLAVWGGVGTERKLTREEKRQRREDKLRGREERRKQRELDRRERRESRRERDNRHGLGSGHGPALGPGRGHGHGRGRGAYGEPDAPDRADRADRADGSGPAPAE
ncbi:DUF1707 SHOCT-like domain-containing protein [Streptomyces daliensis]|uniref:DUF1707 and DUF2154 domain-containing protein n=1 Tax=Streptomyces daliensis TaxID=299421 RepID=A0A8T4INN9_9ACTN|nr:DUF1707 and DUF2154 domain-containing protein [Streptomyces daliensis]